MLETEYEAMMKQMASEMWLCMFILWIFQRLHFIVSRDPLKQNQGTLKEYINCWAWENAQ